MKEAETELETETEPADEEGFLSKLVGAPFIGEWVALFLVALPAFLAMFFFMALGWNPEPATDETLSVSTSTALVTLVIAIATLSWLKFLRRRTGVVLSFFFFPCIWIGWAGFGLASFLVIFSFFDIQ